MKLSHKAALLFATFPLPVVVFGLVGFNLPSSWIPLFVAGAAAWLLFFFGLTYSLLVCPHCGNSAINTSSGFHTPFVGSKCRSCEKPY
ncbi:MAG: hypothetical protein Q7J29_13110 [Stagnimonas sp.]|nr:hypothetical protein [Stagnimonas sp.]